MHPPGNRTDLTLHTQTVAGEAQKFFLIIHHHTAGSPILPGLNCSVFSSSCSLSGENVSFSSHKDLAGEMWV